MTPSIGTPLALTYQDLNIQSGNTHIPVAAMVLARWSDQYVQFRLKFESATDNDDAPDTILIDVWSFFLNVTCEQP
jgi:predicted acyl esterase